MESLRDIREYFRLILASILASVGLMTDDLIAIIASMFLSGLMGDVLAFSMILSLREPSSSTELTQGKDILKGISLIILTSFFLASIGRGFVPLQVTSQLAARASPNLVDLAIATCAGIIGVQSLIHKGELSALISSALAIALVPPASAAGISIAMMDPALLSGSLSLLSVNLIALITTGYISARIYLIIDFGKDVRTFKDIKTSISEFLRLWKALMGFREGESLKKIVESLARRISWIASILLLSLIFAFLITSASPYISSFYKASIEMISLILITISSIIRLKIPEWIPLVICLILAPLSFTYMLRAARGFRKMNERSDKNKKSRASVGLKVLASFILSWLSFGYLLGIHKLGSIGAILTILMISILAVTSSERLWNKRSKILIYAIIIFTLTVITINSSMAFAELYGRAQYSGEFVEASRVLISSYLGVMPDDVRVQAESRALKAQVRLDPLKLEELKQIKGMEDIIEESIREMTGMNVRVSIEYVLGPS